MKKISFHGLWIGIISISLVGISMPAGVAATEEIFTADVAGMTCSVPMNQTQMADEPWSGYGLQTWVEFQNAALVSAGEPRSAMAAFWWEGINSDAGSANLPAAFLVERHMRYSR